MPLKLIFLCSPILLFFFYCLPGNAGDNIEKNMKNNAEQRETSPSKTPSSLKPFTSDGRSAFPDGTPSQQEVWLSCCTDHDYAYWQGGHSLQTRGSRPTIAQLCSQCRTSRYCQTDVGRCTCGRHSLKEQVQKHSAQYRQTLKHPLQQ